LILVNGYLAAIDEASQYQSIIATTADRARERAAAIDNQVRSGDAKNLGRLAGVPFIAKDNFLAFGADTTAASNILRGFDAPYQATAIERLEADGAICIAKANLDAFAHGSSTENSDWFTTKNPHDVLRVPGGSSGGSAAAVMLDLAPFALGTDTGGSIRQPAAFCGAVGLKPTYGLVSRNGVVAMASSTDVIGPITKTVSDAALVLECMAGEDGFDSTMVKRSDLPYTDWSGVSVSGAKIGVIKEYLSDALDPDVRKAVDDSVAKLRSLGAEVEEVSLPAAKFALACYYIVVPAEVSSNLARYDGQRYGYSHGEATTLEDSYTQSRSVGFGAEAKRRIMIGTYVLSSGYYDAYYRRAQQVRTLMIQQFQEAWSKYDILLGPTTPAPAFKIGENVDDPLQMYLSDIMTVAANLVGIPSLHLPTNVNAESKLPVGVQLMTTQGRDRELLGFAAELEAALR
jgi:aspartyl-tRNA(Asn)/glutamyl-tRNA(Gln) amidotransferase subunit A